MILCNTHFQCGISTVNVPGVCVVVVSSYGAYYALHCLKSKVWHTQSCYVVFNVQQMFPLIVVCAVRFIGNGVKRNFIVKQAQMNSDSCKFGVVFCK